jgi:hypothetical protein
MSCRVVAAFELSQFILSTGFDDEGTTDINWIDSEASNLTMASLNVPVDLNELVGVKS